MTKGLERYPAFLDTFIETYGSTRRGTEVIRKTQRTT